MVLLSNILPEQIYKNIKSFIELGKVKLLGLTAFYIEMHFDGLTDRDSIIEEISSIVVVVWKILGDVFDDKVAKALIESGKWRSYNAVIALYFSFYCSCN